MKHINYEVGDCFAKDNMIYLISSKTKNTFILFNITTMNQVEIEENGLVKNLIYKHQEENSSNEDLKTLLYLRGKDLTYDSMTLDLGENLFEENIYIGNINKDEKLYSDSIIMFVENFNKMKLDKIIDGYFELQFSLIFSKSFDKYNRVSSLSNSDINSVGDIFSDNLQRNFFYSKYENNLELNSNFWMIYSKTDIGFFAINLQNLMVFHFYSNGNVSHIVNDIDNRYCHETGRSTLNTCSLNQIKNIKTLDNIDNTLFYKIEEIEDNHFYFGLKLLNKENLNREQLSTILFKNHNLLLEQKYQYEFTKEELIREKYIKSFANLYLDLYNKIDNFLFTSFYYDRNFIEDKKLSNDYFYEKHAFQDYTDKFSSVKNILEKRYSEIEFEYYDFTKMSSIEEIRNFQQIKFNIDLKLCNKAKLVFEKEFERGVISKTDIQNSMVTLNKYLLNNYSEFVSNEHLNLSTFK